MYRTIENHTNSNKKSIQIVGGDFNAEKGPGYGVERVTVGPHTHKEGHKRGDWMKHWLMLQNFTALNTMDRKTLGKQTTYRSPQETEKQIDYILIKRRHLRYSEDAEANDTIHKGSDHRCVMSIFEINAQKKNGHRDANNNKQRRNTMENTCAQIDKKRWKQRSKHPRSKKEIKNSKERSPHNAI